MKRLLLILLSAVPLIASSQTINHWETVIQSGQSCKYLIPTSEPSSTWTSIGFNDFSWTTAEMGIGYGDGDDSTTIANTLSVYVRHQFNVVDTGVIQEAILHMDYDDSFVAYLNGVEIGRDLLIGTPPLYTETAGAEHEALLYQGITPEAFPISKSTLSSTLIPGNNVLAIQVHNWDISSSDMSVIPFLSFGLTDASTNYGPLPSWFDVPFDFDSSNLPIIVINTSGQPIVDDPKVSATIGVIYNGVGQRNYLSDPFNDYSGNCGIELRGESSQSFAKKSYGFEFRDWQGLDMDASFLNFPAEEDFILYGPYSDKSLLNNALAMKLGNEMGHYASRTRFIELMINDEYMGVYLVMEKIKRDNERVDIADLNATDITGDELTGGYIFRIDKGIYDGWESNYQEYGSTAYTFFQFYYPDEFDIQPAQKTYIQTYMDSFENAIASPTYMDVDGNHYTEFIDLRSFVDNFILHEYGKNIDSYRLSSYFHKDKTSRGGKINAGPYWDFNLAFGNGDYCAADDTTGWNYYDCMAGPPFWWDEMLNDTTFSNALRCRWEELRTTKLHTDTINAYLDSMTSYLAESQARNFQRWPVMGIYLWPNSSFYASSTSHAEVMGYMKTYIEGRSVWMDNNIPGVAQYCEQYVPPIDTSNVSIPKEGQVDRSSIMIYPNPASNRLFIKSEHTVKEITITDIVGKTVFHSTPDSKMIGIDIGDFTSSGIYLVFVKTASSTKLEKLVID